MLFTKVLEKGLEQTLAAKNFTLRVAESHSQAGSTPTRRQQTQTVKGFEQSYIQVKLQVNNDL